MKAPIKIRTKDKNTKFSNTEFALIEKAVEVRNKNKEDDEKIIFPTSIIREGALLEAAKIIEKYSK